MRPILYGLLLLGSFLSTKPELYAQCIPDSSAFFYDGTNTSPTGCATFVETPNLWYRSHGTPEIFPASGSNDGYIEMLANGTLSEGIYFNLGSPLVAGNNYDVLMTYNFYAGSSGPSDQQPANGSFAAYAASGVTALPLSGCQDPAPTGPSKTVMYQQIANNQVIDLQYDVRTASLIPSAYSQVWIYPTDGTSTQVALDVSEIKVCPSCYAVVTYSTSTFSPLPVQINGQDITITEPAQDVPTLVEATQAIYLQKGFSATNANNATFVAEISPFCAYSNEPALSVRRNRDSSGLGNLSTGVTSPSAADSAATGLRLYPTLSKGTVMLTGSPTNLANADIIVLSETGQIMYRQYNAAATTLQLNLGNFPNGMYFIQIRQPTKVTTKKVIINH